MTDYKYYAVLQESCSNGYRYEVKGKTLTDVRSNALFKFMNARWHKTADPPMIKIYLTTGSPKIFVGNIRVSKQYNSFTTPYLFFWDTKNGERLVKMDGELGATYEGYKKLKYADLYKQNYPYWRN